MKKPSRFLPFLPDFSSFSLFSPILANFSLSGVALCPPCTPSGYATGSLDRIGNHDVIHEMFVLFWYVWKEEIHIYTNQISIPQAFIFQIHRGVATTPWLDVLQKIAWLD